MYSRLFIEELLKNNHMVAISAPDGCCCVWCRETVSMTITSNDIIPTKTEQMMMIFFDDLTLLNSDIESVCCSKAIALIPDLDGTISAATACIARTTMMNIRTLA